MPENGCQGPYQPAGGPGSEQKTPNKINTGDQRPVNGKDQGDGLARLTGRNRIFFPAFSLFLFFLQQHFIKILFRPCRYKKINGYGNKQKQEENADGSAKLISQWGVFTKLGKGDQGKRGNDAQYNTNRHDNRTLRLEIRLHLGNKVLQGRQEQK